MNRSTFILFPISLSCSFSHTHSTLPFCLLLSLLFLFCCLLCCASQCGTLVCIHNWKLFSLSLSLSLHKLKKSQATVGTSTHQHNLSFSSYHNSFAATQPEGGGDIHSHSLYKSYINKRKARK